MWRINSHADYLRSRVTLTLSGLISATEAPTGADTATVISCVPAPKPDRLIVAATSAGRSAFRSGLVPYKHHLIQRHHSYSWIGSGLL